MELFSKIKNVLKNGANLFGGNQSSGNVGAGNIQMILSNNLTNYGTADLKNFLLSTDISYNTILEIAIKNTIVVSFVEEMRNKISKIVITNDDGEIIDDVVAKQMLKDAQEIFGKRLNEYKYNNLLYSISCGMNITIPIETKGGYITKAQTINPAKTMIYNDGLKENIYYNGKLLTEYSKIIDRPDINKNGYGQGVLVGAIYDAILDMASSGSGISFYKNKATPSIVYILQDNITDTRQVEDLVKTLSERYSGIENGGKPFANSLVKDVKVIDMSQGVKSGLDTRLYSSKMIAMVLGVDPRGLGFMKDGGSQAELNQVSSKMNSKLKEKARRLSNKLNDDWNELVGEVEGYKFEFVPILFTDEDSYIENLYKAFDKGIIDDTKIIDFLDK